MAARLLAHYASSFADAFAFDESHGLPLALFLNILYRLMGRLAMLSDERYFAKEALIST